MGSELFQLVFGAAHPGGYARLIVIEKGFTAARVEADDAEREGAGLDPVGGRTQPDARAVLTVHREMRIAGDERNRCASLVTPASEPEFENRMALPDPGRLIAARLAADWVTAGLAVCILATVGAVLPSGTDGDEPPTPTPKP